MCKVSGKCCSVDFDAGLLLVEALRDCEVGRDIGMGTDNIDVIHVIIGQKASQFTAQLLNTHSIHSVLPCVSWIITHH